MLCVPVFIFTSCSSALLTVATCHIQYNFLILYQFVSRENGKKHENTRSPIRKWPPTVTRRAKH